MANDVDVVDLIMQDHREVERLFDELKNHPEKRPNLLPVLTTLLFAHSRAEEAEVYPAAAKAGGSEDVEHSQAEHIEADELLGQLAKTDPAGAEFDSVLQKVVDAVSHHVEEEESTVLPGMRTNLGPDQLRSLAEAFATTRERHLGEQPDDVTREQLLQQARNADVSGASSLDKDSLQDKLREEAASEEE